MWDLPTMICLTMVSMKVLFVYTINEICFLCSTFLALCLSMMRFHNLLSLIPIILQLQKRPKQPYIKFNKKRIDYKDTFNHYLFFFTITTSNSLSVCWFNFVKYKINILCISIKFTSYTHINFGSLQYYYRALRKKVFILSFLILPFVLIEKLPYQKPYQM